MDKKKKDDEFVDFSLLNLRKEEKDIKIPEKPPEDIEDARHHAMMQAISKYAKKTQQKNLTPVYVDYKTREKKLALVMCPEWAPEFPPFNLARLSGVVKTAGFETKIIDLNVRAYNQYANDWQPNNKLPFRLWDPSASWHWLGETYMHDIHPLLEPLLLEGVEEILAYAPDVVGFSMYYISEEPTNWMIRELKRRKPDIIIAVGGSNVQKDWYNPIEGVDYVVKGEGEAAIIEMMEEIEEGVVHDEYPHYIRQDVKERININGLPMPDYESIDFSQYKVPNGVNSEFSRGCTAKCTFCEETHFWRYRQRQAADALQEAEWLYYNKGTTIMWFIDSLVNGNPNELRAFALGLTAKNIPMKWTGYARMDGRMDAEYFKDIAEGGCIMLNYGCESGSQKVLNDMAKGVTIKEMEDNLRDGAAAGVWAATNWIVGFPTEKLEDFAQSMQFLWRNRNYRINNVGAGVGMAVGPETIVGQNPHKFNVSYHKYQNHWISNDLGMGGTHVMHRVKFFHMFLDFMSGTTEYPFGYPVRFNLAKEHYKIKLHDENCIEEIEYENFDHYIIKTGYSLFADNLVNEIWPFLRMLWRTRGGFDCEILFNPEIDSREFGSQFGPADQWEATYKFTIDYDGNWEADFTYKFDQCDNPLDFREPPPEGRKGPFFAQDYSRNKSNQALRARQLAKPDWDVNEGRGQEDFHWLLEEEKWLNENIDFTFDFEYKDTGKWTRGSHDMAVPDSMDGGVLGNNEDLKPGDPEVQVVKVML